MPRGAGIRRKAAVIAWKVYVPEEIAVELELLLANPILGKPIYGTRSQLITELLVEYLRKVKANDRSEKPPTSEPSSNPSTFGGEESTRATVSPERVAKEGDVRDTSNDGRDQGSHRYNPDLTAY